MKIFRISVLLIILILTAFYSKLQRLQSTAWVEPLQLAIYPINADQHAATAQYIQTLSLTDFKQVPQFFDKQWLQYSELGFSPIDLQLMPVITAKPPAPPQNNNRLLIAIWSLRLRFWAYRHAQTASKSTVNIFIQYQQFDKSKRLAHSLGLQKGLIGVVNAYADVSYQETNNVVLAHELLHTVGASDKYNMQTGQPIYPDGFARPDQQYQQSKAEIMAARVPLNAAESEMAQSLRYCVIGLKTAQEISWIE